MINKNSKGENNMKIKILSVFAMFFIVSSSFAASVNPNQVNNEINSELMDLLDGAFLEERDGVKILHVNGSYYQMGYQHGYFLSEEIKQNLRAGLNFAYTHGITVEQLQNAWDLTKEYMNQDIIDEFQGIADGGNISFYEINYVNLIPELYHTDFPQLCSGFAAWGSATVGGKLIHTYSSDVPLIIEDPVSGKLPQENLIMVVRNPEGGYASMYPAYAGYYGYGGINEQGISMCVQASWAESTTYKGMPIKYRVQLALDKASNIQEATDIITRNKTIGWNVIVSDSKVPESKVVEMNGDTAYIGTYDNDCESTYPFFKIDDVVRRTNFYISPSLAADQRSNYRINGINKFYPIYRLYLGMSKEINKNLGNININNSMEIMIKSYNGEADRFISLVHKIGIIYNAAKKAGYLQALYQWSATPDNGDMLVTFASRDNPSYENEIHLFNLYELLGV
jgi:hypothetical protein